MAGPGEGFVVRDKGSLDPGQNLSMAGAATTGICRGSNSEVFRDSDREPPHSVLRYMLRTHVSLSCSSTAPLWGEGDYWEGKEHELKEMEPAQT